MQEDLFLRGHAKTSFLTLRGILHGAPTLRGSILSRLPNPAWQIQLYQRNQ